MDCSISHCFPFFGQSEILWCRRRFFVALPTVFVLRSCSGDSSIVYILCSSTQFAHLLKITKALISRWYDIVSEESRGRLPRLSFPSGVLEARHSSNSSTCHLDWPLHGECNLGRRMQRLQNRWLFSLSQKTETSKMISRKWTTWTWECYSSSRWLVL